jgi:hypothetical protein
VIRRTAAKRLRQWRAQLQLDTLNPASARLTIEEIEKELARRGLSVDGCVASITPGQAKLLRAAELRERLEEARERNDGEVTQVLMAETARRRYCDKRNYWRRKAVPA